MTFRRHVSLISLIAASGYLAAAFALKAAERGGYISHDAAMRALPVFNGLMIATYGNFLPKKVINARNPARAMRMQEALRTGGWAFMLGGLGFAVTSLLPLPYAVPIAVLGTATAYMLGYMAWSFLEHAKRSDLDGGAA